MKVLIADNDEAFRTLLTTIVTNKGYNTVEVSNGEMAMETFFSTQEIIMCILDVMMSQGDGWEVLNTIRRYSNVFVMVVASLGSEEDELKALRAGANEYMTKPVSYPLLVARIENLLKNVGKYEVHEIIHNVLSIDYKQHRVYSEGVLVTLNHKEYQLLYYLVQNKNQVLTREQILIRIWGFDYEGDIRTIDTHIKTLRKKLGKAGESIKTIRGIGYQLQVIA